MIACQYKIWIPEVYIPGHVFWVPNFFPENPGNFQSWAFPSRQIPAIQDWPTFTSVHLNNNNYQINLFNSRFKFLLWEALDSNLRREYQTELDPYPQYNGEWN